MGGDGVLTVAKDVTTADAPSAKQALPEIQDVSLNDLLEALGAGMRDFQSAPLYGLFFGGFYAVGGWFMMFLLGYLDIHFYVYPLATGFALIAPFVAAGLYEVSRRLERGEPLSWANVLGSVRQTGGKDLVYMVLVMTFSYIIWVDIAAALYVMFFGLSPLGFVELLNAILTTPTGFVFFMVGNLVGLFLGLVVFSVSVVSFPLLYDRSIDFVSAMITSVKVVRANPKAMLVWCFMIVAALAISILSAFVGLLVLLPIFGHASWHLYRRALVQKTASD